MTPLRVASLFFEELPLEFVQVPRPGPHLHGRLLVAIWLAQALAAHPDIAELALCGTDVPLIAGTRAVPVHSIHAWFDGSSAVWFEPARHYWWRPAVLRQAVGSTFPIVTTLHGVGYAHQVLPLIGSLVMPKVPGDTVIAPSHHAATVFRQQCDNLIDALGLTRQPPNIVVIPYGVPAVEETPYAVARRALGWDQAPVVLFVGRLSETDKADFAALFEAVARLRGRGDCPRLVLAGACTDESLKALRQRAHLFGLTDLEVRFNISDVEKHLLLSGCDIFVSPSNAASESFGLAIIEAMLHGRAVVCSSWSGYREIVRDDIEGLLIDTTWQPPTNGAVDLSFALGHSPRLEERVALDIEHLACAIGRLINDVELRERLGDAARRRARSNFLIHRTVDAIVELLDDARERSHGNLPRSTSVRCASVFRAYAKHVWTGMEAVAADNAMEPGRLRGFGLTWSSQDAEHLRLALSGETGVVDNDVLFRWLRCGIVKVTRQPDRLPPLASSRSSPA